MHFLKYSTHYLGSADIDCLLGKDTEKLQRSSALFLLKLKEERRITQVAIDDIVNGSRTLFSQALQQLRPRINAALAESDCNPEDISGLDDAFADIADPFKGLETCALQEKYFRDKLELLVSYTCIRVILHMPNIKQEDVSEKTSYTFGMPKLLQARH